MRRWVTLAAFAFSMVAVSPASAGPPDMRATLVEGRAEVLADAARYEVDGKLGPKAPWKKLTVGAELDAGAAIRTQKHARVELVLADGSRVRLAPSSQMKLGDISGRKRSVSLTLWIGRLWAKVARRAAGEGRFEVKTKNAVAGVRGTSFAVLANADLSSLVKVYTGTVGVRKNKGFAGRKRRQVEGPSRIDRKQWEEVVLTAMKQVRVTSVGEIAPAEDFMDTGDELEWAMWNQERDHALE